MIWLPTDLEAFFALSLLLALLCFALFLVSDTLHPTHPLFQKYGVDIMDQGQHVGECGSWARQIASHLFCLDSDVTCDAMRCLIDSGNKIACSLQSLVG